MKNIITILLILILPVVIYIYMSNNSDKSIAEAKNPNLPTVMTFTSTMCMDCQKMKAVLFEVEPNYVDKVNFQYIQALEKSKKVKEAIKKYNVVLVPTVIILDKDGMQLNKIEGFIEKENLIEKIEKAING